MALGREDKFWRAANFLFWGVRFKKGFIDAVADHFGTREGVGRRMGA